MAELNLNYYTGEDLYSDGDIEVELLRMVEAGLTLDDLPADAITYPVLYHLSDIRENILNWYPFHPNAKILEIGAGCGAITGMLCEKCETLISVELSKRRAQINYERHKHYENLHLYVGNFNAMEFPFQFDYVILNGVFEYAMGFTDGNEPYVQFLKNIAALLKNEGKILIAIENKLGLKYFAGAAEDHVGQYFFGLNDYPGNESVRTFSKLELIDIFEKAGIDFHRFYYPYPDYKFPIEIFTDKTLESCGYGKEFINFDQNRYRLFHEERVSRQFLKEGIMDRFANSFLIEISRKDFSDDKQIIYTKMNNYRAEKFQIITTLQEEQGNIAVYKKAMKKEAKQHIEQMHVNTGKAVTPRIQNLVGKLVQDAIQYPFLTVGNLNDEIQKLVKEKEIEKVLDICKDIYSEYKKEAVLSDDYHTAEFAKVFGADTAGESLLCIKNANVDLICDNIYKDQSNYIVIDCEWILDFYIPVQFVIYRLINDLYSKFYKLNELMEKQAFFEAFDITESLADVFHSWSIYFMRYYVSGSRVERYAKPIYTISIDDMKKANYTCALYYDIGDGFNETHKIVSHVNVESGEFSVDYDLSGLSSIKALRWDPLEGDFCCCEITDTDLVVLSSNATAKSGNKDIFITTDPMYIVDAKNKDKFSIHGKLHLVNTNEAEEAVILLNCQKSELALMNKKYEETQYALHSENVALNHQLNEIYQSKGWKILDKLRSIRNVRGN